MNRHWNMHHLHLGCGESLSQLLDEPVRPADGEKPETARPRLHPVKARKPRKGGGRR